MCLLLSGSSGFGAEKIVLQSQTPKMDRLPPPRLLQGGVGQEVTADTAEQHTNVLGYSQFGEKYPKEVTYVRPNSLAWRAGLQAKDRIIEAHATPRLAGLIVQRGKKRYFCMIDLKSLTATLAEVPKLQGKVEENTGLNSRQIVMMVDDSASMGTLDCPDKKSRWQWCREHIKDMYADNNGALANKISIVTFDSNFRSFRNCEPGKLKDVFENVTPAGETNLSPALEEAFSLVRSQLEHGKPALISLISDGRPTDVENVKKSIISEVNRLSHPELLSIVFIEVGTPERYLRELDEDLIKQGAAKDIVSVMPFNSVNTQPLTVTLSSAVAKVDASLKSPTLTGAATTVNVAKTALDNHVFTLANTPPPKITHEPIKPKVVVPIPQVKAHPTGTAANGEKVNVKVEVKPVEIDEKESVLKHSANKTY